MQNEIVLFLGGSRSGKSVLAENYAAKLGRQVVYVATAGIHDLEMEKRVKLHQERRPRQWLTMEERLDLSLVWTGAHFGSVILVDCLTLWVTNLLLDQLLPRSGAAAEEKEQYILNSLQQFIEKAAIHESTLILVSNEVGLGIVPDNELSRLFRDIAGKVNQCAAGLADRVFFVAAGIPVEIKRPAADVARGENH